ncbi:MAG: tetratricopeptide repeat protein [Planctomycetes bacterium]|nr:tetratricopeptide repeat protein [Planctomycetota bacterium]
MKLQTCLIAIVLLECAGSITAIAYRRQTTLPVPPHVDQYNDTLTGDELLALPTRFLFDRPVKWRTLAETYASLGYFSKADGCYRRLAATEHTPADTFHHGYCLVRLGRLAEARTAFQTVIDQADRRFLARAWYFLGTVHLREEQAEAAQQAFEKAGDDYLPALFQRAKYLARGADPTAAVPLIDQLAEALPQDVHVWQLRSLVAAAGNDPAVKRAAADGLEYSQSQLALDDLEEFFLSIRRQLGMTREVAAVGDERQAGRATQAAERLARLVNDETRWDNVYLYLLQDAAAVNVQAGNLDAARDLVMRQIDVEGFPTPTAWQIRGEAEFARQNWADAVAAWTRAETMKPDSVDHVRFATAIEQQGTGGNAKRHLAQAGLIASLGMLRAGQFDQARTTLRQAISIDGDLPEVWYYLGECERFTGQIAAARAAYRRALELNPAYGRAASALREKVPGDK